MIMTIKSWITNYQYYISHVSLSFSERKVSIQRRIEAQKDEWYYWIFLNKCYA